MDHVKCGYTDEDEVTEVHDQCNGAYIMKDNRQFVTILHDPLVKKVLKDTDIDDEGRWGTDVWTLPAISILTRLCFHMEGMTELINDTFIENLSAILSSCVEGKYLNFFFETTRSLKS